MLDRSDLTVVDVMTADPVTVTVDTSLRYVAKLLAQHRISGVPVVDETRHVVGIVTESDLLQWSDTPGEQQAWWLDLLTEDFELSPDRLDAIQTKRELVSGVMKANVATVVESTPLTDVARLLVSHAIKRVPVLRDGQLVGIVSRADLVGALARG